MQDSIVTTKQTDRQDVYHIDAARGAAARGIPTSEGFVVLGGSKVATSEVPSTPAPIKVKRSALIAESSIVDWVIVKDLLFSSPSLAAAVVLGRSANGQVEWKLKDGASLKDSQAPSGNES